MKLLFLLFGCLVGALSVNAQTSPPDGSGLRVVTVKVEEKTISTFTPPLPPPAKQPTPTLGRGTADRTDSERVAILKEVRADTNQRMQDLRNIGKESPGRPPIRRSP